MEAVLHEAIKRGDVPGFVIASVDAKGTSVYTKGYGKAGVNHNDPMDQDTVVWLASATKLITSIAALQCTERGLLNFDTDVTLLLPELKGLQVLSGFDERGQPLLREPSGPVRLRHLLTHTSGFAYEILHPLLTQYRHWQGIKVAPQRDTIKESYLLPLVCDPGTGWVYGSSLDWVGQMIERVSGQSLNDYCAKHIFEPLGIRDMTHHLQQRPDLLQRRAHEARRNDDGTLVSDDNPRWHQDLPEAFGGHGLFGTAREYIKILRCVLENDGTLLSPTSMDLLFTPCLSTSSQEAMDQMFQIPQFSSAAGALLPHGSGKSHALGGMVLTHDLDGWRRKGCLVWSGAPNVYWSIDRAAGISCLYVSQINPPGDLKSIELATAAEKAMYEARWS